MYVKAKQGESLLGQLGFVLDETPAEPSAPPVATNGQAAAPPEAAHHEIDEGAA